MAGSVQDLVEDVSNIFGLEMLKTQPDYRGSRRLSICKKRVKIRIQRYNRKTVHTCVLDNFFVGGLTHSQFTYVNRVAPPLTK